MVDKDPFYETEPSKRRREGVVRGSRPLDGAGENNRSGNRLITIPFNAGSTTEESIINILSTPKGGGEDAEVLNLTLDMDLPVELGTPGTAYTAAEFDVIAVLEWGVGGTSFSAEMDWYSLGSCISIHASTLKLSAILKPVTALAEPDLQVRLKAALSYGSPVMAGVSTPARRTFDLSTPGSNSLLAAVTSPTITIPKFAVGFTVVDGGQPGGGVLAPDLTVTLSNNPNFAGPGAKFRVTDRTNVGGQNEGQFPVPLKSRFLNVRAVVDSRAPKVIFNLGL